MISQDKVALLCAKLISRKVLPKAEASSLFRDESLRLQVEERLRSIGLELATHIYTDHVAVKVCRDLETAIFDDGHGGYQTTNIHLSRGAVTLLVVLWAKLILPKRQRQIERRLPEDGGQIGLLQGRKVIPQKDLVKVEEKTLLADFGEKLGGKTKFGVYLGELSRNGFIVKREGIITEGPMLDTLIDYGVLAPRIIDGCLAEVVGIQKKENAAGSEPGSM